MSWGADPRTSERGWENGFVYAKTLKLGPRTFGSSAKSLLHREAQDEWLETNLRKDAQRRFSGTLKPRDKLLLDRRLAVAGRDLNRGKINQETYREYVDTLLGTQKENSRAATKPRPASAPAKRTVPVAWQSATSGSVPVREVKEEGVDYVYQARVKERSERDRKKAMAWMTKVASAQPQPQKMWAEMDREARDSSEAQTVRLDRAPAGCSVVALKEAMAHFGPLAAVEQVSRRSFVVRFRTEQDATRCATQRRVRLKSAVLVSPVPRDLVETSTAGGQQHSELRKMMSRWGKVTHAKQHQSTSSAGAEAVVVFESPECARRAVGQHHIQASCEVRVAHVPPDATVEHVKRAFGGRHQGLEDVRLVDGGAVLTFASAEWARRSVGQRQLVITQEANPAAYARAQRLASKGKGAPWHSAIAHRPFADFELHSNDFGGRRTSAKEFRQRAAGTWAPDHVAVAKKDDTGPPKFTTRKVFVSAKIASMVVNVSAHDLFVEVE